MAFALASGIITQSGTDTNLSGLAGIAGVTTITFNGRTVYSLSNLRLRITGTLSHDPELEEMFFFGYGNVITLDVRSGGVYNIGSEIDVGAEINRFSTGTAIRFAENKDSNFAETSSDVYVSAGGTLNWYGGSIFTKRVTAIYGTLNTFSQNCQLINQDGAEVQVRQRSTTTNINGLVTKGVFLTLIENATQIANWTPYDPPNGNHAIGLSSSTPTATWLIIRGFDPRGCQGAAVSVWRSKWCRLVNCLAGSGMTFGPNNGNTGAADNVGLYELRQELTLNYLDLAGSPVDGIKTYTIDTDSGDRIGTTSVLSNNPSYTADRVYSGTSAAGQITFDTDGGILVAVFHKTVGSNAAGNFKYDYRSGSSADLFVFYSMGYNEAINQSNLALKGINGSSREVVMLPDFAVTEPVKATVDAYTSLDTAQQVYDRAKADLYDNYVGETQVTLGRSGAQLELADKTLVINSAAGSVYNLTGATVTILSSAFTGGATATTGGVTVTGAASISDARYDCDVSYDSSATTITNVTCTGVMDFTTAGTYSISGCNLAEVTNSSGGAVILNLANGSVVTTNTGPNITVSSSTSLTLTGLKNPSEVRVYDPSTLVGGPSSIPVTNGTFDTDLSGWTASDSGTGVSSWSAGRLSLNTGTGNFSSSNRYQAVFLDTGSYELNFDAAGGFDFQGSAGARVAINSNGSGSLGTASFPVNTGPVSIPFTIVSPRTVYIIFGTFTEDLGQSRFATIDNVTLTKDPNSVPSPLELAGQEDVTTGSFSAVLGVSPVDISILSLGFQNIRLKGVDTSSDLTLPIQQVVDRQYAND